MCTCVIANVKTGVIIHIGILIFGDTTFALIENPKATIDVIRYDTDIKYMDKTHLQNLFGLITKALSDTQL